MPAIQTIQMEGHSAVLELKAGDHSNRDTGLVAVVFVRS